MKTNETSSVSTFERKIVEIKERSLGCKSACIERYISVNKDFYPTNKGQTLFAPSLLQ